ncbi:GGDEF domain-containing protein [Chitinibacter sp. S2-10]|uniref:GGDEF domain-containing protein n=1 Tax=Chitinibacter sp. S2-10 TaxID=3373597 RepID=UPI003977970F
MKQQHYKTAIILSMLGLISIALLLWQALGMQRHLRITPDQGYRVEVADDREIGGGSVVKRIDTPGKWHFSCELAAKYEWPFCELAVFVGTPQQGLDLSRFDTVEVKALYRGPGSHQMRIFVRDFDPAYADPAKNETWKVQGAFVVPPADGKPVRIGLDSFPVASWWISSFKIPPEKAKPSFDNVPLIQFGSSTLMEPGHHEVIVDYIEFQGKWLSRAEVLLIIATLWVLGLSVLFLGRLRRVEREKQEINEAASRDPLTGARNRAGVINELNALLDNGLRLAGKSMGVIFADIDHFKRINDAHGHATGDEVLKLFANELQRGIRNSDYLVRWGGEEFVVFLPLADLEQSTWVANKLHRLLHEAQWPAGLAVTASFGVALSGDEPLNDTIARADAALYRAKHGGRDRVEIDMPPATE